MDGLTGGQIKLLISLDRQYQAVAQQGLKIEKATFSEGKGGAKCAIEEQKLANIGVESSINLAK